MITLVDVLTRTEAWLRERGVPSPRLDVELLLCEILKLDRVQLYLAYDRPLDDTELEQLRPLVRRRGQREPMAWILGRRAFHALDLEVGPGVLVPRPDTETLVDAALEWIPQGDSPIYVADVGCGTGAVGLALATARPEIRVYATDMSPEALQTTRRNVDALTLASRVAVLAGDLLTPVPPHRPIDWVVSNPPYIASAEIDGLQPEVSRWEPRLALDGGPDGLAVIRRLVDDARRRARSGLLLEVGHDQATRVRSILASAGFTDLRAWNDLGGVARVVGGRTPSG